MSSNCTWTSRRTNRKMGTGVRRQNTIQVEANISTLSTHGTLHILVLRFPGISTLLKATASRYQSASNKSHPTCASRECRWCCISLSQGTLLLNSPLRATLWATAIGIHRAQQYCTLICSLYSIYASFPIGDMWITRELFMVLWTNPLLEIWLEAK